MITITGTSVFHGVAIGPLHYYRRNETTIRRQSVADTAAEVERFEAGRKEAIRQLQTLYEKAVEDVGEANAAIFDIHQMMLDDMDYQESVTTMITTQKVNAEYAVSVTSENFARMFAMMDDAYMQGRAADVKDVSERVLQILHPGSRQALALDRPSIIAAQDLAPSETVQLEKDKVLGFATAEGSANSHTAILARTMGIPAAVSMGEALTVDLDGKPAILDGFAGTLYIEPDAETLAAMERKQREDYENRRLLEALKGQENSTLDGHTVQVFANVGNISDLGAAIQNDAGGIGLFRSEFLYLESEDYPTEQKQFAIYRQIVETMGGKKVIIRTLDIGADKQAAYFGLPAEENPALGMRAIRICLTRPEVFKTQLRALFRASVFGNLSIMFPMIASLQEIEDIMEIVDQVKGELRQEAVPFREDMEIGIMIETPAAVLISRELAERVDFFSVGTNDLTQYTLAIDRQNQQLDRFYDPRHPAIVRMLAMAAESAHAAGKWIGVCGELAADPMMTEAFLRMGIDELSVSPGMILRLRQKIRSLDLSGASQR